MELDGRYGLNMFYVYVLYVYALYALFGGGIRGGVLYDAHERMLFILFGRR